MFNESLSEFIGALIGDGCLSKYWSKYDNRWRYVVAFTGQWNEDHQYYKKIIQPIVLKEFGVRGYIYHRKDDNTVRFFIQSKRVVSLLNSLGLPIGVKKNITIPKDFKNNLNLAKSCIRGIFNTDGSVYRRYSKQYSSHPKYYKNYAVIQFKMRNRNVIKFIKYSLEKLGLKLTKIGLENKVYWVTRITSQKDIERFFEELEINHQHHLKRFREIKYR